MTMLAALVVMLVVVVVGYGVWAELFENVSRKACAPEISLKEHE